jgi:thiamine-monophosphate kinase
MALAAAHKTPLAGGDLAQSPLAVADIVLVGAIRKGRALLRSGARPGDTIYVTGSLGGAAAGLAALSKLERKGGKGEAGRRPTIPRKLNALLAPHLYPQPRMAVGLYLQRRGLATAALDVSDGLSTDLAHLCEESGVGARIEAECLPIHAAATLDQALHGGEDYELLFTARPGTRIPRQIAGVPATQIGTITKARSGTSRVEMSVGGVVSALNSRGWEHFS